MLYMLHGSDFMDTYGNFPRSLSALGKHELLQGSALPRLLYRALGHNHMHGWSLAQYEMSKLPSHLIARIATPPHTHTLL